MAFYYVVMRVTAEQEHFIRHVYKQKNWLCHIKVCTQIDSSIAQYCNSQDVFTTSTEETHYTQLFPNNTTCSANSQKNPGRNPTETLNDRFAYITEPIFKSDETSAKAAAPIFICDKAVVKTTVSMCNRTNVKTKTTVPISLSDITGVNTTGPVQMSDIIAANVTECEPMCDITVAKVTGPVQMSDIIAAKVAECEPMCDITVAKATGSVQMFDIIAPKVTECEPVCDITVANTTGPVQMSDIIAPKVTECEPMCDVTVAKATGPVQMSDIIAPKVTECEPMCDVTVANTTGPVQMSDIIAPKVTECEPMCDVTVAKATGPVQMSDIIAPKVTECEPMCDVTVAKATGPVSECDFVFNQSATITSDCNPTHVATSVCTDPGSVLSGSVATDNEIIPSSADTRTSEAEDVLVCDESAVSDTEPAICDENESVFSTSKLLKNCVSIDTKLSDCSKYLHTKRTVTSTLSFNQNEILQDHIKADLLGEAGKKMSNIKLIKGSSGYIEAPMLSVWSNVDKKKCESQMQNKGEMETLTGEFYPISLKLDTSNQSDAYTATHLTERTSGKMLKSENSYLKKIAPNGCPVTRNLLVKKKDLIVGLKHSTNSVKNDSVTDSHKDSNDALKTDTSCNIRQQKHKQLSLQKKKQLLIQCMMESAVLWKSCMDGRIVRWSMPDMGAFCEIKLSSHGARTLSPLFEISGPSIPTCFFRPSDFVERNPRKQESAKLKQIKNIPVALSKGSPHINKDSAGSIKCEFCDSFYSKKRYVRMHMYRMHRELMPSFTCGVCNAEFQFKETLLQHKRDLNHKGSVNPECYQCEHCGNTFNLRSSYTYHIKYAHSDILNCICNQCGKKFKTKGGLNAHIRNIHEREPTVCDICGKVFQGKVPMLSHRIRHNEEKKCHSCEYCGKAFFHKAAMMLHVRIHTGEKPFKCDQCTYACNAPQNLQKHMKIHVN